LGWVWWSNPVLCFFAIMCTFMHPTKVGALCNSTPRGPSHNPTLEVNTPPHCVSLSLYAPYPSAELCHQLLQCQNGAASLVFFEAVVCETLVCENRFVGELRYDVLFGVAQAPYVAKYVSGNLLPAWITWFSQMYLVLSADMNCHHPPPHANDWFSTASYHCPVHTYSPAHPFLMPTNRLTTHVTCPSIIRSHTIRSSPSSPLTSF
jgi:hypothetical protein